MPQLRYRSDILQDSTGDIYINPNTNDFDFGASDVNHINDIIVSFPGWWKQFPSLGVGVMAYLKGKGNSQSLLKSIRLQMQSDGYRVNISLSALNNIQTIIQNANLI